MSLCPISVVGPVTGKNRHGPGWVKPATASWKCRVHWTTDTIWPGLSRSASLSTTRPGR